jgi:hypothetical protein
MVKPFTINHSLLTSFSVRRNALSVTLSKVFSNDPQPSIHHFRGVSSDPEPRSILDGEALPNNLLHKHNRFHEESILQQPKRGAVKAVLAGRQLLSEQPV